MNQSMYLFLIALFLSHFVLAKECSGTYFLDHIYGSFTDGDDELYENNMNCTWIISPKGITGDNLTLIVFEEMSIEYYADFISIYEKGIIKEENLLYKSDELFGETVLPPTIGIYNRPAVVNFLTDSGGQRKGFKASYYTGFCDLYDGEMNIYQTRTKPYMPLISNYYHTSDKPHNKNYRNGALCIWNIIPREENHYTSLYFKTFDLAKGDKIVVKDLNSDKVITTYDGGYNPTPIFFSGGLQVIFSSNKDNIVGTGFEADIFFDECPDYTVYLSSPHGILSDGSHPDHTYKTGKNCKWVIKPGKELAAGGYIQLSLAYLELNDRDTLTIFSSDHNDGDQVVVSFTSKNNKDLKDIKIESSVAYIEFLSVNGPSTDKGFQIEWSVCDKKCLSCGSGTYYVASTNECKPCGHLEVTLQPGQLKCGHCPAGTFWKSTHECEECPVGTYNSNGTTLSCRTCVLPKVATEPGSSKCEFCPENTVPRNTSFCTPCKENYIAKKGATECEKYIHNSEFTIIVYMIIGISLLVIGGIVFVIYRTRKRRQDAFDLYY